MKTVLLACLAAALAAGAFAAVRPTPFEVHSALPDRPFRVLGPVDAVVESRLPGATVSGAVAPLLAAEARRLHGRAADAVLVTDSDLGPNGVTLLAHGLAVGWE